MHKLVAMSNVPNNTPVLRDRQVHAGSGHIQKTVITSLSQDCGVQQCGNYIIINLKCLFYTYSNDQVKM